MTRHDRRGDARRLLSAGVAVLLMTATAEAQTSAPGAAPAAKPAPAAAKPVPAAKPAPTPTAKPVAPAALEAARVVWEAQPLADRIAVQDGLVWTGDYSGSLDGTFGRMTFEAITAFQGRHGFAPDGILTAPASKLLADTGATKKAAVGFQAVDDAATGVRIHLPTKLLGPATRREAGSRWVGREGRVLIETYAFAEGDLAGLFERMKAEAPGRKVVYSVLRPDWFVVSDEAGGRHGYARFVRGAQGIRGFQFTVDGTLATELDRVVIATAGRFEPFPGAATAQTAPMTPQSPTTPQAQTTPKQTPTATAGLVPASGFLVSPGWAITATSAISACKVVAVGGREATVTTADAEGIATLEFGGVRGRRGSGTLRVAASATGPLTVLAYGESGGKAAVVAVPGEAVGGRMRAALQRGAAGAPVFDADGAIVGLVLGRPDERRAIAGLVPPADYELATPAAIAASAASAGSVIERGAAGEATTTGAIVRAWAPRVVTIDCLR